ncbi:uncharacterized protein BCR38DRAFT_479917 [Pseudomassariella vexata]|uniref:FAD-binding PCMH-type domain-containing protein n=1 Tax=Pseudomassariella vexata TaxID=1141098 RepID=A0A1Y2EKQ0_9PEZI|nr:uncharacterized protein BCR38DRAFT_479917 [Pseudomassariella vexata]ORY71425.1 hypothetical protein BCR38DRAFT_479917 [Pseudomassariella vexata]
MASLFRIAALLFPLAASGLHISTTLEYSHFTRRLVNITQAQHELGSHLSSAATIFGPTDPDWANATERYTTYAPPKIQLVVVPGIESDIPTIVKWSNQNSLPFLVKNRGHSLTSSTGKFNGIQIDMSGLRNIDIQPDGKTAWFQGGTYDGQVMEYLWDRGYVATTGSCACVGMMGPGLGGGHGRYQGLYSLISDNLVNLNVVLADGSAVVVNETENSGLWWGMQGAGHNFGIVTSFELKIYPKNLDTWHYHNYIFTQDKLEPFFDALNTLHNNGSTPVLMALEMGGFAMDPTISETEAILTWSFGYAGPAEDAEKLLEPFNQLGPVHEDTGDVPFPDIPAAMGTGQDEPICSGNQTHIQSSAGLQVYNITAERQIYTHFNQMIADHPEFAVSVAFHEGYATEAVTKVDPALSAVPYRDYYLLTYFEVKVPTDTSTELKDLAHKYSQEIRDLWNAGAPDLKPLTYVNYAFGDESLESIYGYEPWRLERLRGLKQQYDPNNAFAYYNPII